MKYLYITNGLFPTERVDVDVLFGIELARRGDRTDLVFQPQEPCAAHFAEWKGGMAWVAGRVAADGWWAKISNSCRRYGNIARSLRSARRSDYACVQVRDGHLSGLMALIGARLGRKPFVYWMSFPVAEYWLHRGRNGRGVAAMLNRLRGAAGRAILRRLLLPQADHVFVQSHQMAADLAHWGISPSKMTPVPMGVDPETTKPAAIDGHRGERWIGYLGTLDRIRNIDLIVESFALVLATHPDTRLILAGSANRSDTAFLKRRIADLGVSDRVVLTGQLPRAEALGYMQACEVCLAPCGPLPMLQSSCPTKLVEYLFLAKPVVASEQPEHRKTLDASGGGVCVKHDPAAFADATRALLDDPERRAQMGARGRDYILQHRTYDQIAADVDQQYRRLFPD